MLNFTPQKDVGTAQAYPWQGDYLGTDMVGAWIGKLADELGLSGTVEKEAFDLLCENKRPDRSRLTPYNVDGRLIYTDATFNAPKSFSVIYDHFSGSEQGEAILKIFRREVRRSISDMEKEMQQPVLMRDDNGKAVTNPETGKPIQVHPFTGNLLAAEFIHFTARPVEGIPDPHLHAHIPIFNATKNLEDDVIRSGYMRTVRENAPLHEARFHSRLSKAVSDELEFKVTRDGNGFWRVAGVPHSVDTKFSRRTQKIEEVAEKLGANPKTKAKLAKVTREAKSTDFDINQLHNIWNDVKSEKEKIEIEGAKDLDCSPDTTPTEAIEKALASELERASCITERDLMISALKRSMGSCSVEEIEHALQDDIKGVIKSPLGGKTYYTTKRMFEKEQTMFNIARDTRGSCLALHTGPFEIQDKLVAGNSEQVTAINQILSSNDKIMSVVGGAGVGKTTMAKELVRGVKESGYNVVAMAPTNDAVDVLKEDGFKDAMTLDRFLLDKKAQEKARGQVVFVDESGLISVNKMVKLFKTSAQNDFRVVLSGDDRQHSSVEAGDALRLLHEKKVVTPAVIRKIVRQRDPELRSAIKDISLGDTGSGFEKMDNLGCIHEATGEERHGQLAVDYLEAVKQGKEVLVVAPTHREGHEVTKLVRGALKKEGLLGNDRQAMKLESVDMTLEQRTDAVNFQPGMVLEFHQKAAGKKLAGFQLAMNKKGETFEPVPFPSREKKRGRPTFEGYKQGAIQRGGRLTVIGRDEEGHVYATNDKGKTCLVPTWDAEKFSVHEPVLLPLTKGDKLRFTGNGETKDGHRIINGQIYDVIGIRKNGDIEVKHPKKESGKPWVFSKDFGHINHGYVSTSVASQGSTVDKVFIAESVSSGRAASMKQFYVSASRARETVKVYTEDKDYLLDLVSREGNRMSATEIMEASANENTKTVEQAASSSLALVEMVAKHIQWEKAKAKALGVVESVKEAAASVAHKVIKAGIDPLIGQQALAMAGGLADVQLSSDTSFFSSKRNANTAPVSAVDLREQAAELGKSLQAGDSMGKPIEKESLVKQLGQGRGAERPRSGNLVKDLKADSERNRLSREADMEERRAARDDKRGFSDKTDSSRWDIRQEQQAQRKSDKKSKNKSLLADMSTRFRKMRDGPD